MIFLSCSSVSGANWNKHSTVNVGGWTLLKMPDNSSLMVHILSFQKTNKLELVLTAEMLSTSGRTAEETSLPRNLFNTVHFLLIRGGFIQFRLNVFSLRPMCYVCALVSRPSTDLLVNFQSTLEKNFLRMTSSLFYLPDFRAVPHRVRPNSNAFRGFRRMLIKKIGECLIR